MTRLVEFRLSPDIQNFHAIKDWCNKTKDLRNAHIGHKKNTSYSNEQCKKDIQDLLDLTKKVKGIKEFSEFVDIPKAFRKLAEQLEKFCNAYSCVFFPTAGPFEEGTKYRATDLFAYHVLIAFPDVTDRNMRQFVKNELSQLYGGRAACRLYVDSLTVDDLANLTKSNKPSAADANKFLVILEDIKKDDRLEVLETDSMTFDDEYITDTILKHLCNVQGRWCVITGDARFAQDIASMEKRDGAQIIVAKICTEKTWSLFGECEREHTVTEPTPSNDGSIRLVIQASPDSTASEEDGEASRATDGKSNPKPPAKSKQDVQAKSKSKREEKAKTKREEKWDIPSLTGAVFNEDEKARRLMRIIADGGEGIVYDVDLGHTCVKLYREDVMTEERSRKLRAMRNYTFDEGDRICWPLKLVWYETGRPIGFEMTKIHHTQDEKKPIPLDEAIIMLNKGNAWEWSRVELIELCRNILKSLKKLHNQNILMGDINPKNILVNKDCEVWFIDTDSYQFEHDGTTYRCEVGLPEFSSPRLHQKKCCYGKVDRTIEDERFAMAALFFYVLFLGESPFPSGDKSVKYSITQKRFRFYNKKERDHSTIWGNLSPDLHKAFTDVFQIKGAAYPDDDAWKTLFEDMLKQIDDGRFSKDLEPSSSPESEAEGKFERIECKLCHQPFAIFVKDGEDIGKMDGERRTCPACKRNRAYFRSKIVRLRCQKCGEVFTANIFDITRKDKGAREDEGWVEFDTSCAMCPDCDPSVRVPKEREFTIGDTAEKRLKKAMKSAVKNYKRGLEELIHGNIEEE